MVYTLPWSRARPQLNGVYREVCGEMEQRAPGRVCRRGWWEENRTEDDAGGAAGRRKRKKRDIK